MTILVTGGAGFIGSNFILNWLKSNEESIINIDKLTYAGNLDNLKSIETDTRHIFFPVDINNSHEIHQLLTKYKIRAIFHFAAESHVDRSINSPDEFIQTNIVGSFNLLDTAYSYWKSLNDKLKEEFRFVHISTDEVYGSLGKNEPAFTEMHRYEPNSPYSASKAASDHLVRAYYQTYNFPVLTTNCSNNYGPYQHTEKLIPLCIKNALSGKPLPVYGDGLQIRDWLYVIDHCEAISTVLSHGRVGEVYNIGGWNEKPNIEVVNTICSVLDELAPKQNSTYKNQITYVKDRFGHDRRYAIDSTKIALELDWKPKETFNTGIRKTIEWYLTHHLDNKHEDIIAR